MSLPRASADFYRSQQRLAVVTVAASRRAWSRMGPDFDRSWAEVAPKLVVLAAAAQLAAARAGAAYVPAVLVETGQPDDPAGEINPRAFAGTAPDGRPLDTLLYGAVTTAKSAVGSGSSPSAALAMGGRWLDGIAHTLVADAGRQASGVAIAARPRMGYVRMTNPPSCPNCAILAGKFFRFNAGFDRHPPTCDCTHIPSIEDRADDFRTDPQQLLERGQITGLTEAERKAIADGADLGQVVNARRGTSGLRGLYTTEGTTRRGYASYVKRELDRQRGLVTQETARRVGKRGYIKNSVERRIGPRPTPEAIYRYATSREEAIRLLSANGYIVGGTIRQAVAAAL